MGEYYLSVDLGGTSLRLALLDAKGKFLHQKTLDSDQVREAKSLVDTLIQSIQDFYNNENFSGKDFRGVALGIPGLVDSQTGTVYQSPHFPRWRDFALGAELKQKISLPLFIDNDANVAALGEHWKGAAKDWSDFIMLTLGTGVGGGIIFQKNIYHGTGGLAGEVGHIIIDRQGIPGAIGVPGTLETFTSLSGLKLQLRERIKKSPRSEMAQLNLEAPNLPEILAAQARDGNSEAREVWEEFGKALACGIASLANTLGIFNFVIGGGLSGAWDLFSGPCLLDIPKRMYQSTAQKINLVPAQLGDQAGLFGGVPLIKTGRSL